MGDLHFEGKTALVTGAGAGIGRASAQAFARRGVRVMAADIDLRSVQETVEIIRADGGEADAFHCDATREESVAALVQKTLDRFGSLDFAHNNVGSSRGQRIQEVNEADYQFTIDVTFKSVFLSLKHELPVMARQGGGAIVNTASMSGVTTTDTSNIIYAGAKAGVIHMTRYAARMHAKDGIRVNCVAPGLVATKVVSEMFTPEQQDEIAGSLQLIPRIIRPEEVAATVLYLCSADAAMITGVMVPVDGGINVAH